MKPDAEEIINQVGVDKVVAMTLNDRLQAALFELRKGQKKPTESPLMTNWYLRPRRYTEGPRRYLGRLRRYILIENLWAT
ncbi:MAG: hypothetical protein ACYC0L_06790 [Thermoleophilia bacterium]